MAEFYGIKDIEFIWRGTQSDPLIRYKNKTLNYWDIEDGLYYIYKEEHKARDDICHAEDDEFAAWLQANKDRVYGYLDDVLAFCC